MARNRITINLNEETLERLDKISFEKYRGVDRSKAIRWLIDDTWEGMEKAKVMEEVKK
jgi:metal-responsive CopG/Arc/MetJ family transcriptional regulator